MIEQRGHAAELELLDHVDIHARPFLQIRRNDLEQPPIAGVAFHADPQRAAFAGGVFCQDGVHALELRQQPIGGREQMLACVGQSHPPAFTHPDGRAGSRLQLANRMAQGRLAQVQGLGGRGQRAFALDFAKNAQVHPFDHSINE